MKHLTASSVRLVDGLSGTDNMRARLRQAESMGYEITPSGAWVQVGGKTTFLPTELLAVWAILNIPAQPLRELATKGRVGQAGYLLGYDPAGEALQSAIIDRACDEPYRWAVGQSPSECQDLLTAPPTHVPGRASPINFRGADVSKAGSALASALRSHGIAWDASAGRSQVFKRTAGVEESLTACGEAFTWHDLGFNDWQVQLKK